MAVGNVGESLAPYTESDTFLSRDAGFTWEEVHKDAHTWEFGDSGSILIMANDEEPTDHVLFSTDEGLNWREYVFTTEKVRVKEIVTVPSDTSRRFVLIGYYPRARAVYVAVHIDFSALTSKQCTSYLFDVVLTHSNPFVQVYWMWKTLIMTILKCGAPPKYAVKSASLGDRYVNSRSRRRQFIDRFATQTLYHRRVRNANCVVGVQPKAKEQVVKNCECTRNDFEWCVRYQESSSLTR